MKPFLKTLLSGWERTLASIALAIVFFSVVWGVLARYVAQQPATWSNEVATICFAWVVFLGAAAAAKNDMHLGVDLIVNLLPENLRNTLQVLVNVTLAGLMFYITWLAIEIGYGSVNRPTPVLRLPYTVVHAGIALGTLSIGFSALRNVFSSSPTDVESPSS